jgi:endonuclease-3 related protein
MRHQLIEPQADYHQLKELFESNLAGDVQMFNEFHALLVACGKKYCRVKPLCRECPLNGLPHVTDPSAA